MLMRSVNAVIVFEGTIGKTVVWSSTDSWEGDAIPTSTDTAFIDQLAVNPSGATVGGLIMQGGLITEGTLTVNDSLTWTDGAFGKSGRLIMAAGANATLTSGGGGGFGKSWVIENRGTWEMAGSAILTTQEGSIVNTGVFKFTGGGIAESTSGGTLTPIFENQSLGLIEKASGSGSSYIKIELQNDGTITAKSGTLELTKGGTHSGAFISNAGVVEFNGGEHRMNDGASFGGTQASVIETGTLNIDGDTVTAVKLTQNGGTIQGDGTLTVSDTFTFNSGSQGTLDNGSVQATGSTVTSGGAKFIFPGASTKAFSGNRVLRNAGTIEVTGSGEIQLLDKSSIQSSGTIDIQTSVKFEGDSTLPFIDNSGTLKKTSMGLPGDAPAGAAIINTGYINSGLWEAEVGILEMRKEGANVSGTMSAAADGILLFNGGRHLLDANSKISGEGIVEVKGSSDIELNGPLMSGGMFRILGGKFENNGTGKVVNMEMRNGEWSGTGSTTVSGAATITGGAITGNRPIIFDSLSAICTFEDFTLSEALFASTAAARTRGNVNLNTSASLRADGVWSIESGADILGSQNELFSVSGSGTLTIKPGSTRVSSVFDNNGRVRVEPGGVFKIEGGGTHEGGFIIDEGGALSLSRESIVFGVGADITGGKLIATAGNRNNTVEVSSIFDVTDVEMGSFEIELKPGGSLVCSTLVLSGGEISGAGNVTCNGPARLQDGIWSGTGTTNFNGATEFNELGDVFITERTMEFRGVTTVHPSNFSDNIRAGQGANLNIYNRFILPPSTDVQGNYNGLPRARLNIMEGGTCERTSGTSTSLISTDVTVAGTLRLASTGQTNFSGKLQVTSGVIELEDSRLNTSQALDLQGGALIGNGTIFGDVECNGGAVKPGKGIGRLTLLGDVAFGAMGTLDIDINGTANGLFDVLDCGGSANLAGPLRLSRFSSFQPMLGDSFAILTADSINGQFTSVEAPRPDKPIRFYKVSYGAHAVTASYQTATLFSEWQQGNFTAAEIADLRISGTDADPDGDGISNFAEYAYGLDPRNSSTSPVVFAFIENGNKLTITFPFLATASDVDFQIFHSADLATWTFTTPTQETTVIDSEMSEITYTVDVTGKPVEHFYRLTVQDKS